MKRYIMLGLDLIFVTSLLLFSCKKQSITSESGQIEINFSINSLKSTSTANTDSLSASTLTSVIVSVEDLNGNVIKNSEKIDLYNMNGSYISKPLSLPKGNYKLTRFFVLDWQNNIVYAAPLIGSSKANLVAKPLPLIFSIQTNSVTKVVPEVLNAAGCTPADFGYATFSFNVSQTFDFLVGTFIYDDLLKNYKLTSSTISIYANTDSIFTGQLIVNQSNALTNVYDSLGITNKITLPERFNKYTLVVSKPGYKKNSQIFTKEELKLHLRSVDKGPLVIILEKVPITLPTLTTNIVSDITQTTATCGGSITSDGGGAIIARGVCWSKSQTPTITDSKTIDGLSSNSFTSLITGLAENTTYYVRAYATNSFGTGYGNTVSFQTLPTQSTVTDVDGNVYQTVTIGTQIWMAENLKTTHYRNGDLITHVEDGPTWWAQTTEAYCEYGDVNVYGRLYNWYAVMDNRNICPVGYHIPSNTEWQTLINYLGGDVVAGGKLKETGINHWADPNTGATNSSGFTALPAGYRHGGSADPYYNYKANLTWTSVWWTSTPNPSNGRAYTWLINYSQNNIISADNTYKGDGLSVRCIKD